MTSVTQRTCSNNTRQGFIQKFWPGGEQSKARYASQRGKTRFRNRISDVNLARLMRITIQGPELASVNFDEILEVFKEKIVVF